MANSTNKSGSDHTSTTPRTGDQNRGSSQAWSGDKDREETTGGTMAAVKEKVQDVACSVADAAGRAKDTVKDWASTAADTAGQAKDKAKEMASTAVDKAQEWGTVAKDKAQEWGDDLTGMIRRNPLPALFIGLGIGFLVGQMLRRS